MHHKHKGLVRVSRAAASIGTPITQVVLLEHPDLAVPAVVKGGCSALYPSVKLTMKSQPMKYYLKCLAAFILLPHKVLENKQQQQSI